MQLVSSLRNYQLISYDDDNRYSLLLYHNNDINYNSYL